MTLGGQIVETMARAIYDATFDERYDDLHPQSIERAMAHQQARAAIQALYDFWRLATTEAKQ
jgi:23S rRNA maturation mini-RNase III